MSQTYILSNDHHGATPGVLDQSPWVATWFMTWAHTSLLVFFFAHLVHIILWRLWVDLNEKAENIMGCVYHMSCLVVDINTCKRKHSRDATQRHHRCKKTKNNKNSKQWSVQLQLADEMASCPTSLLLMAALTGNLPHKKKKDKIAICCWETLDTDIILEASWHKPSAQTATLDDVGLPAGWVCFHNTEKKAYK